MILICLVTGLHPEEDHHNSNESHAKIVCLISKGESEYAAG